MLGLVMARSIRQKVYHNEGRGKRLLWGGSLPPPWISWSARKKKPTRSCHTKDRSSLRLSHFLQPFEGHDDWIALGKNVSPEQNRHLSVDGIQNYCANEAMT